MQIYVVLCVTKINRDPNAATLICGISDYFKETSDVQFAIRYRDNEIDRLSYNSRKREMSQRDIHNYNR